MQQEQLQERSQASRQKRQSLLERIRAQQEATAENGFGPESAVGEVGLERRTGDSLFGPDILPTSVGEVGLVGPSPGNHGETPVFGCSGGGGEFRHKFPERRKLRRKTRPPATEDQR